MSGIFAIAWALCAAGGTAWAAPGDHIRVGDVEVVPDIDLGAEYRTNVYRSETGRIPSGNLRFAPGLTATAAGDDHEFRFGGEWELRKFFFVADPVDNDPLTGAERVRRLDRFNEFAVSAGFDTFRRNLVGFKLSNETGLKNWTADAEFSELPYTSQFRNDLNGGVRVNPGPALEIVPGGAWAYDSFQVPGERGERGLNKRNTYGPRLDAKWAFLPRTSLVVHGSYMFHAWQTNLFEAFGPEVGADFALPNSQHIKFTTGVDGRFTEKLSAQGMIGYGVALYDEDSVLSQEDLERISADLVGAAGILAKAQVRYQLNPGDQDRPGTSLAAGYVRDFRDSFFTNFVSLNQLFVQANGRLGDFQPMLRYELRFEDYRGEIERNDVVNRFTGDIGYWFSDWAAVTAGMWWQQRASSTDNVEYDDFNLHAMATFTY